MKKKGAMGRGSRIVLLPCLVFLLTACGTPVGVKRVSPDIVHHELTSNVLSTGAYSGFSEIVLNRHDLHKHFTEEPEAALAALHGIVAEGRNGADEMFALAELSFLQAEKTDKRAYYLAASLYAYGFLFPGNTAEAPSPFDSRFRVACDLYNRGLTSGLISEDRSTVEPHSGTFELPFGELEIDFDRTSLKWHGRELVDFKPVAELAVHGLRNRYRQSGIGAPLAAGTVRPELAGDFKDLVGPKVKVPVTLVLRLDNVRDQLASGRVRGTMRLHATEDESTVVIGNRAVPLEAEPTASVASMLADSNIWEMEIKAFLGGEFVRDMLSQNRMNSQLAALHPYQPGLIPVVFVHGTASSAGRWAEMANDLLNDPEIRKNYQFWYFYYDTGNPIPYSASLLRETLTQTVAHLDPEAKDAALRNMVVIGHSQGGLLAKMTAIDSGARFWSNVSPKPLEELQMTDTTRDLLRRAYFFKPLPFVKRLIFIATPQRGSYIAGWGIIKWVTGLMVKPAKVILTTTADILKGNRDSFVLASAKNVPTSVDNMNPSHRFIKTLAATAPRVPCHSIIAVKQKENIEKGNDGVVAYASAHLEDAESELVVCSGHSCQGNPHAIEEVRRILLLHAGERQALAPLPECGNGRLAPFPLLQYNSGVIPQGKQEVAVCKTLP